MRQIDAKKLSCELTFSYMCHGWLSCESARARVDPLSSASLNKL
jgi:hypothetical protein